MKRLVGFCVALAICFGASLRFAAAAGYDPVFIVQDGVPADQVDIVRVGTYMAKYYFESFRANLEWRQVTVIITPEIGPPEFGPAGHPANTLGSTVYIYTGSPEWQGFDNVNKYMVLGHSYTHALGLSLNSPSWINEGFAEYFGWKIISGIHDFEQIHLYYINLVNSVWIPPLSSLEDRTIFYDPDMNIRSAHYGLGFLTVDYLVKTRGLASVIHFVELLGYMGWWDAFPAAFGISMADFYAEVEGRRAINFSPYGKIIGTIKRNGVGVAGIHIYACPGDSCQGGMETVSGADGNFSLAASDGTYFLVITSQPGASTVEEGMLGYYGDTSWNGLTWDWNGRTQIPMAGSDVQLREVIIP